LNFTKVVILSSEQHQHNMTNLLYGSSNIYRHFSHAIDHGLFSGLNHKLVLCTKKAVFNANRSAYPEPDLIVTSVLENLIVGACLGLQDDEVQLFAHQQITAHVESLFDCVTRYLSLNVTILPPLFRSNPAWFSTCLPDIHQFLISEVARFQSPCLTVCHLFIVLPSLLEDDGVHLVPARGGRFLAHLDGQMSIMLIPLALWPSSLG